MGRKRGSKPIEKETFWIYAIRIPEGTLPGDSYVYLFYRRHSFLSNGSIPGLHRSNDHSSVYPGHLGWSIVEDRLNK